MIDLRTGTCRPASVTALCLASLALLLSGCARTERARKAKESGFLKDYTLLRRTKGDRAQLLYVNNKVDWERYTKVIIEPVSIWRVPGSKLEDLPENELQELGRYFHEAIRRELAKVCTVVDKPSPGTMRLRLALTEAGKSNVVMDTITSVVPIGLAVSYAKKLATGTHAFVGKATAECELRSTVTGELLAAAVASQVGGKVLGTSKFSSWGDVKAAADAWAVRFRGQFAKARAGEDLFED